MGILFSAAILGRDYYVNAQEDGDKLMWNDQEWQVTENVLFPRGQIVYYSTNTVVCNR